MQRPTISKAQLDAMVEDATVDCYNEDEQITGLARMDRDLRPLARMSAHPSHAAVAVLTCDKTRSLPDAPLH